MASFRGGNQLVGCDGLAAGGDSFDFRGLGWGRLRLSCCRGFDPVWRLQSDAAGEPWVDEAAGSHDGLVWDWPWHAGRECL